MKERITLTCKNCNSKSIINIEIYNSFRTRILVCEKCSHILLPKRLEGKKPNEVE